jgi:hypothetical protein
LDLKSNTAHISPTDAWNWIEIDPQFVRVIKIAGSDGVWVQLDAT